MTVTTSRLDPGLATSAEGAPESSQSAVTWTAVFAGAFVTVAIGLMLVALGAGVGLSSISPWRDSGVSATTLTVGAAVWLIVVQWLSAALGAYVTGRLRTKWVDIHTDEVMFRDTAHGLLTWAVAAVFGAFVIASAASSLMNTGSQAATNIASGNSGTTAYFVDTLFRTNQPASNAAAPDARPEATRIMTRSLAAGRMTPDDRTWLATLVEKRTGLSQQDAEKGVDDVTNQAKAAADTARKNGAKISLYTFFSMLIGAFIAAAAGAIGGRARDA